jgi:flagellar hook-associated protein 2
MSTSSINSLLNTLNPSNESLAELLGESTTSNTTTNNASTDAAVLDAVDAILNSATNTSGSGIDVTSTVDAILELDAEPEENLQNQVTALNSQTSALQTIETDLTNLQTAVQALNDPMGAFGDVAVNSSNNDVVSATAANGTATGSHTIYVNSLATTSAAYSAPQTSATSALPTGTLTIQVGSNSADALTVPVDTNSGDPDTLNALASYINKQNMGVTASVITTGSTAILSLVSQTSGSAGILHITDTTGGGSGLGIQMAQSSPGQDLGTDASLTVDGVPVTSGSNTVTGVIPGVTLTLSGTSSNPVTLDIQPDLTQVSTGINNFVSAWNQLMSDINAQNTYSGTGTAPPLLGDPSLDLIQSQLLNDIATSLSGNGAAVNLQSIGIHLEEDGTLTTTPAVPPDSMDLNDALANDFSAVQNLFQSTSPAGVAQTLNTDLTNLTDSVNGPLNLDMSSISSQESSLNDQISEFQYQLQQTQAQLTTEYSTINTTLEQLPETLNAINQQLDALNPPNQNT